MKALLNLVSLAVLVALGAGIWLSRSNPEVLDEIETAVTSGIDEASQPDASSEPEAAPEAPAEDTEPGSLPEEVTDTVVEGGYTVEGTQPGYFIAGSEIVYNGYRLQTIQAEPAQNGFDESVRIMLDDTRHVTGTNDRGEYYETVALTVDAYAITRDGISIMASHPDIGPVTIEGTYDAFSYEAWTSGADAVENLFTADVSMGGMTIEDVPFSFWIGD